MFARPQGDENASKSVNFIGTAAVVLASSPACHHTLLPLKQRRKWFSAVEMGDPFVGDRSLWCFHFWQSGRRFALSGPFGSGPMGKVTLGGSLCGTRRPNSTVPTGTSSELLRAFRVATCCFQLSPCRPRTCCLHSLCAACDQCMQFGIFLLLRNRGL